MSNADRKKKSWIFIFTAALLVVSATVLFLFSDRTEERGEKPSEKLSSLPFEKLALEYGEGEGVSFTATVKKENLKEFFDRKGVVASALFKILPDETELLCEAEMRYDAKSSSVYAKISSLHLNGISVPPKLLSEFGEIELDFKRSLVYN